MLELSGDVPRAIHVLDGVIASENVEARDYETRAKLRRQVGDLEGAAQDLELYRLHSQPR